MRRPEAAAAGLLAALPLAFVLGFVAPGAAGEPVPGTPVFAFTDPDIVESSGLVVRDGLVVTVNDSGDGNRVFTVDPATGDTVGTTSWGGEAVDIEALAPAGPGEVWVGDIGDNLGQRDRITVSRVPVGAGDRTVEAASYDLVYPDGPHDAETLLAHPVTGRLHVVSKEFIGRIYAAPAELDPAAPNELELVDEVLGIATDGAFSPDGSTIVVRNYAQAAVYSWPDLERLDQVDLPRQEQGEGLAVDEAGEVFLSSEGAGQDVLRVDLPLAAPSPEPGPSPTDASSPAPSERDEAPGAAAAPEREVWPWLMGGVVGLVAIMVLVRSLRPRGQR